MAVINGIVSGRDCGLDINNISSVSQDAHDKLVNMFTESNYLYNISSATEDIVLNRYLSIFNTAKSIASNNVLKKNYILESFTSQDYVDLDFHVDRQLNIDTQNGILTLPVEESVTLKPVSLIVEDDSNGTPGNSYAYDFRYTDPSVILQENNSSMFEYEKITNIFSTTKLYFSCTIKLESVEIANGCYIRLYADNGDNYPVIETIEVSLDGKLWTKVDNTIDINKADYFVRFMPTKTRYIKVRFAQDYTSVVRTKLGTKYRYCISIREISIKRIMYKNSGTYVSVPFANKKDIKGISFFEDSISYNDITYMISGNNGGKWLPIKHNETIMVDSSDMGLVGNIDIAQIRVKINMDRVNSPNAAKTTEFIVANTNNIYYLKYKPIKIDATLGGHISYGTSSPYVFYLNNIAAVNADAINPNLCSKNNTTTNILYYLPYTDTLMEDTEVRVNGALLKNDGSVYYFYKHNNEEHSIIMLKDDTLKIGSSAAVSINYKPYIYDHRYSKTTGSTIELPQNAFIESSEGINVEQIIFNSTSIPDTNANELFDNNISTVWTGTKAQTDKTWDIIANAKDPFVLTSYSIMGYIDQTDGAIWCPKQFYLEATNDPNSKDWIVLDSQIIAKDTWTINDVQEFSLSCNCAFQFYRIKVQDNCHDTDKTTVKIINITFNSSVSKKLELEEYTVIPKTSTSHTKVIIKNTSYNPLCDYRITYQQAISLSNYMPKIDVKNNTIDMQALHQVPQNAKICFEYTYEDIETISDISYYTPICREYRLEII